MFPDVLADVIGYASYTYGLVLIVPRQILDTNFCRLLEEAAASIQVPVAFSYNFNEKRLAAFVHYTASSILLTG